MQEFLQAPMPVIFSLEINPFNLTAMIQIIAHQRIDSLKQLFKTKKTRSLPTEEELHISHILEPEAKPPCEDSRTSLH